MKNSRKNEIINLLKGSKENPWHIKPFFFGTFLLLIDAIIIWFFAFNYTLSLFVYIGLLYSIPLHCILIAFIIALRSIDSLTSEHQEEAYNIAKEFILFLETKKKTGTKIVKKIINRIPKYNKYTNKTYRNFYFLNFSFASFFFELSFFFTISVILFRGGNQIQTPGKTISSFLTIELIFFWYFSVIFSFDLRKEINIKRVIKLLEIAFQKDLNICLENIKNNLSKDYNEIEIESLISLFNQWYAFYLGNYFDESKLNAILNDFHDLYININIEEKFYDTFFDMKVKLQDGLISNKKINDKNKIDKFDELNLKIENFLDLLDFRIKKKIKKKQSSNRKWLFFTSTVSVIGTIIAILTTFDLL